MELTSENLKFSFSSVWLRSTNYEELLSSPTTAELTPIASSFCENVSHVRSLGAVFPDIAYYVRLEAHWWAMASANLGRPIEQPTRVRNAPAPDKDLQNEFNSLRNEWFENIPKPFSEYTGQAWQDGCDLLKPFVDIAPEIYGIGLEAVLRAKIIQMWAATEALLSDTLIGAMNLFPHPLATRVLGDEKSFSVNALKSHSYNLSHSMGLILSRMPGKIDINSFDGLKKAYVRAFSDQELADIFYKYERDISHLEALRNLIAHRSGKADDKFINRVKSSSIFKNTKVDEYIIVSGETASHFTLCSVNCAAEIFCFVDRWIYGMRNRA